MAGRTFKYQTSVVWTGNRGSGTSGYRDYGRDYDIDAAGRPTITGSSDPAFLGDEDRYNPEDLLLASLSACHMLWYLHLAVEAGVVVESYRDEANGTMELGADGGGRFTAVTLRPVIVISATSDASTAAALHEEAHAKCYIANSVNFPVSCEPEIAHAA